MQGIQKWVVMSIMIALSLCALVGFSDANSASLKVTASVKPSVDVAFSPEDCIWDLNPSAPGTYTKKVKLMVRSNSNWAVTVKEDNVTRGYMTEWTGSGYGEKKLSTPMRVKSSEETVLSEGSDKPLTTGIKTGPTPQEIEFIYVQDVTAEEALLARENGYRMVVTFKGVTA
jgi:hypothetical protein